MNKIKDVITAISFDTSPKAVKIQRKEHKPMSYECLELVLKYITRISIIVAGTVLILNVEIYKILALLGFVIFFSLIYLGMKD